MAVPAFWNAAFSESAVAARRLGSKLMIVGDDVRRLKLAAISAGFILVRVSLRRLLQDLWAALHELDFVFRQAVEIIDQRVDLLVGGGDGVLERGLVGGRLGGAQRGHQGQ